MPNPDELIAILDRILNGSRDESEVAQLRQWLKVNGTTLQFVSQDGKFNTNIGQVQGGEIHIGDRHYQFDFEALRELLQPTTPLPNIDWHAVSQAMLEEQLRLTTNPLTSDEGISYRTEQVYVPLGLVERKRQTRRGEDVSPEQGSLLYEETEITQRFEHEQFLEQVLQQGQSPKSRGKRLAIIGEPGAGKTTLLQQVAQWVSEQVEGAIAIWVSLADLRGQELEASLLEGWLQAVVRKLGQAEASSQVKDAFVAQFGQGRVWLLLDGVDEMQVSSGNPLAEMERQVRMGGLLSQARIVLTCRLNLWDGDRNALDTFDTYRTLEFSYPQQVEQFIGQWFEALPEGQEVQAERLCAALKASGKERIRDLVKNPLRLTLLCFNWYLGEGTLPETKAGLYEQFVADFYEWKREQFPTTAEQRRRLNAALGELAREALDKEATRFRLRHDFVCEILGELDELNSLFQLALQLGWLNKVGVDGENPRKAIYAFFHPTFQEYFAALAIDNCYFFLNHIPENPSHPDASYRIFEPQWKEVFLLWLGQGGIAKSQKEELIKTLVTFEDEWEDFYKYKAYFLAASGTTEFKDCSRTEEILSQLLTWGFGDINLEWHLWHPLAEGARKAIQQMERTRTKNALIRLLNITKDEYTRQQIAETLCEIDSGNSEAVNTLISYLVIGQNGQAFQQALWSLEKIGFGNYKVIATLTNLLNTNQKEEIILQSATTLGTIDPGNNKAISTLIQLIYKGQEQSIPEQALESLGKVGIDNLEVVSILTELLNTSQDEYILSTAAESLGKIDPGNSDAIDVLLTLLRNSQDEHIRLLSAGSLGLIAPGNLEVVSFLSQLIHTTHDKHILALAAESLGKHALGNHLSIATLIKLLSKEDNIAWRLIEILPKTLFSTVVSKLKNCSDIQLYENFNLNSWNEIHDYDFDDILNSDDFEFSEINQDNHHNANFHEVLWYCTQSMTYIDFYQTWHS
jgi:HEAT repeat protein/energy-coupling factor transporter ATP-binding protein EcfA2